MKDFCTKILENKWLPGAGIVMSLVLILFSNYCTTYIIIPKEGTNNVIDTFPHWKWIMHMGIIMADSFLLGKYIDFKKLFNKKEAEK